MSYNDQLNLQTMDNTVISFQEQLQSSGACLSQSPSG